MGSVFKKPKTPKVQQPAAQAAPAPNYEEQRKEEEKKAAEKKKSMLNKGRSGTILGGSVGDDSNVKKAKLGA